jgi:hypothetical protein
MLRPCAARCAIYSKSPHEIKQEKSQPIGGIWYSASHPKEAGMHYEVVESKQYPGHWHVEAIDGDGRIFVAIFSGPNAVGRAREYAGWKNSVLAPAEKSEVVAAD